MATDQFEFPTEFKLVTSNVSRGTQAENSVCTTITLQTSPQDDNVNTDVLSAIIIAVSMGLIGVLIVVCVITVVIYVRLLRRPDPHQNLYAEVGNSNPIYEAVDKDLSCTDTKLNVSKCKTEPSYVNTCGKIAPDPAYMTQQKL